MHFCVFCIFPIFVFKFISSILNSTFYRNGWFCVRQKSFFFSNKNKIFKKRQQENLLQLLHRFECVYWWKQEQYICLKPPYSRSSSFIFSISHPTILFLHSIRYVSSLVSLTIAYTQSAFICNFVFLFKIAQKK